MAGLPDPIGEVADGWTRPNGLRVHRVRVPLGVVAPRHDWVAARSADERLAGRAAHALRLDPLIDGRRLEICVQNGVIILLGELASDEACEAAGRRAWAVAGVVDVCNQLTVSENGTGNGQLL